VTPFLHIFLSNVQLTLHILSAHWCDWGIGMTGFTRIVSAWLLLAGAAGLAACGSGASGLITGSTPTNTDTPGAISNDSPLARPIAVAWTSARAKRCGFYFDPGKLRASYLAYEARQSNGEQLAKSEKSYDTTFKVISDRVSSNPDYCTDRKGAEIKADLVRYLKGDYTPNLPKEKKVETCGFFGCGSGQSEEKFDTKKFWEDVDRKNVSK
jgi:hypothetical protein